MSQKAEIERMDAAFKRAADKAMHGTREERSGRFDLRGEAGSTPGETQPPKVRRGSDEKA